jgi:hypothetical protein
MANDSDPDGDPLRFNGYISRPQHGTLIDGPTLTTPFYQPNNGYVGPDSFIYEICDSLELCADATVSLNVVNNSPIAGADSFRTHINIPITVVGSPDPLTGNDSDPDGDSFGISSYTQPTHGRLSYSSPTLSYQPSQDYAGPDSFTYQICDSYGACATGNVTLTVTANDDAENDGDCDCHSRTGGGSSVGELERHRCAQLCHDL